MTRTLGLGRTLPVLEFEFGPILMQFNQSCSRIKAGFGGRDGLLKNYLGMAD